jgi:hypothetical protein
LYLIGINSEVPHQSADAHLPEAAVVLDAATTLDTALDRLDPQSTLVELLVRHGLLPREFLAMWLLGRHEDRHLREREGQEAQIL